MNDKASIVSSNDLALDLSHFKGLSRQCRSWLHVSVNHSIGVWIELGRASEDVL